MLTLFSKVFIIQNMRVGIGVSTELDHLKAVKEAVGKATARINADTIDFALLFATEEFSHPLEKVQFSRRSDQKNPQ